jgi:hypothetical protein
MTTERLKELLAKARDILPIVISDGPLGDDGPMYAEATGVDFQAMTVNPRAFEALNELLPALPALIARIEEVEAENARLSKAVCSGVLGELLSDDESVALAAFIKDLRASDSTLLTPNQRGDNG